jgi:hypothetical protein
MSSSGAPSEERKAWAMSFVDMREWIARLDTEGELRRIKAEVDWDRELGAIARRVLEKKGPALLFERIKGYETGRCTKLFISGLGSVRRLALSLGFPKDVSNRDLVQHVMKLNRQAIPPKIVATGPVKEVVVRGSDIDQTEFPVPKWHYLEGGRYIHTFSGIVTRDSETRAMNVGIYRGMIGKKNTAPFLLIKGGQHWGTALPEILGTRRADAGGLRGRLGSDHAVPGRLADPDGRVRVGRDGRLSREPAELGALRDRRSGSAGERRDRHRGLHQRRPGHVRERGTIRRVHGLRVRRADAAPRRCR